MLIDHVLDVQARQRLQKVIDASLLDKFADWLAELHYSHATIHSYIYASARFVTWARANGYGSSLSALDSRILTAYRIHLNKIHGSAERAYLYSNSHSGPQRLIRFLRERGITPVEPSDIPPLVIRFCDWMRKQRGTREATLDGYRRTLCRLLRRLRSEPRLYTAAQLRDFVLTESRGFSHSKAVNTVAAVRMFIRFLVVHQECPDGLQYAIPPLAKWGQAPLPRYLAPQSIERILNASNGSTPLGARDCAVLLLLARLGLRAGDVAKLRLGDLDWRRGRIWVRGKSQRSASLPLPQDVGDAILHYLMTARPSMPSESLFLISRPPYSPVISRQISATAARAIRHSGISTPSQGAHIFRHSAATAWLHQGLSLQSIGSLLRHCDLDTTAIYAKVDVGLLQQIALPWPREEATPC